MQLFQILCTPNKLIYMETILQTCKNIHKQEISNIQHVEKPKVRSLPQRRTKVGLLGLSTPRPTILCR